MVGVRFREACVAGVCASQGLGERCEAQIGLSGAEEAYRLEDVKPCTPVLQGLHFAGEPEAAILSPAPVQGADPQGVACCTNKHTYAQQEASPDILTIERCPLGVSAARKIHARMQNSEVETLGQHAKAGASLRA